MSADHTTMFQLTAGGHDVVLRIPTTGDWHPLIAVRTARTAVELGLMLPSIARAAVASLDGTPMDYERAKRLATEGETMRTILGRVREVVENLREAGAIHAECPHCQTWSELAPVALALMVRSPSHPVFDGAFFALPALGHPTASPRRPATPCARALRCELPSARLGIASGWREVTLGADPGAPAVRDIDELELDDLDESGPGFQGVAHLAALTSTAIETIEAAPVIDFLFLDLVYFLAYCADIEDTTASVIRCAHCTHAFLPIVM